MTFEQLLYVEVLSHYNSLQKAADALHISKPGLSLAISDLEKELGVKNFARTNKGSVLTEEGVQMLSVISEILRSKSSLERLASFSGGMHKKQSIRIHYINTMFRDFMEPFIEEYNERYPDVYYEICRSDMKHIIAEVRAGRIDAGFVASSDIESELIRDLKFEPVCYSKVALFVSKDSPLLHQELTAEELRKQRFCIFDDYYQEMLFERLQYLCGPLDLVLKTDDSWAIAQAITKLGMVCPGRSAQALYSHEETDESITSLSIGHLINDNIALGWLSNPCVHRFDAAEDLIARITGQIRKKSF